MREDPIDEIARERFGVSYLYPIQRFVISNILDGIDQIVVLPTGAGKSLCYWIPLEIVPDVTLVVTPLLALMKDQLRRLSDHGIAAGCLMGGQSKGERRLLLGKAEKGELKIIFTTPETLIRLASDRRFTSLAVGHLVVDEAHCVSEWGRTFRPSYRRIGDYTRSNQSCVITAFTATASGEITADIREVVFGERAVSITAQNPDRPNIFYRVLPTLSKAHDLVRLARQHAGCFLIFCMSRRAAELYSRILRQRLPQRKSFFYHAGLSKEERQSVESWFMASTGGILVATSAYGLGVDKPDIRTVVHADIPPSVEAYLQESGRAGRDGKPAEAILLYSQRDILEQKPYPAAVHERRHELMKRYALNRDICRRSFLLSLMGQNSTLCSGCDTCQGKSLSEPSGERAIVSFITRNRRRFSKRETLLVLGGRYYKESITKHLDSNPGFGLLKEWDEGDLEEAVENLLFTGRIKVLKRGFWKGKMSYLPSLPRSF